MKRTPLTRKTPFKSSARLSRSGPVKKVNRERLDKRTKAYRDYMQSAAWKGRRALALVNADWSCARCCARHYKDRADIPDVPGLLTTPELHVHHKTYARFGHELQEDLEVLCEACHDDEHASRFIKPRGLWGGRN